MFRGCGTNLTRMWRISTLSYSNLITPVLRDYQQLAIDKCVESFSKGVNRIGVSLATGGGKTVVFANLINQLRNKHSKDSPPHKTLILVHRRELALQAAGTIKRFSPLNANVQIEMGKYNCDVEGSDVIIASVQSLLRRLDKYDPTDIDLIIIDEAHHVAAQSYLKVLKHFNADTPASKIPVVGFSATFERADNKALSTAIDEIVYHRGILEMIDDDWLCEGKFTTVDVNVELSNVETTREDFKLEQLSKVMNTNEINKVVLQTYLHKKKENNLKSALLFAVDVEHVKSLHQLFVDNGINAQYVTGTTKSQQRDCTIQDFKNGKVEVLLNCGIFTEGTDIPNIDCILLCRPTRSRSLLIQMIGRGLRKHHSKDYCHIVDFIGSQNVGVISVPSLAGIDNFEDTIEEKTLEDLLEIKKDIDNRKQFAFEEKEKQNDAKQLAFQNMINGAASFDLTLTTFEDFKSFSEDNHLNNANESKEANLLRDSRYPWVKFSKNAWGLPLHDGHHLRLYKENIKDKTESATKEFRYTLKLYREIPSFYRDHSGVRFVPRDLITTKEVFEVMGKVEQIIRNLSTVKETDDNTVQAVKNFTKFAKWRSQLATPKQRTLIYKKLKAANRSSEDKHAATLTDSDIRQYVDTITKGESANIIFATTLAPVFPLKSLLHVLEYKKRIKPNN